MSFALKTGIGQLLAAVCAAGVVLVEGWPAAAAALLGGAVAAAPTLLVAFAGRWADTPQRVVGFGFVRVAFAITLLVIVIAAVRPDPLGFFAGFVLAHVVYVVLAARAGG